VQVIDRVQQRFPGGVQVTDTLSSKFGEGAGY